MKKLKINKKVIYPMNPYLKEKQSNFQTNQKEILDDFCEFLKFKTISTISGNDKEMNRCVKWLEAHLTQIGFNTQTWETSRYPTLFAQSPHVENAPTLLIYHHYDVQPVDPLNLWNSDPFEPRIENDKIYARGASDNKGQAFYTLLALKYYFEDKGNFPFNIKLIVEGEEEYGSQGLCELLETKKEELQSDYLLVVDVGLPDINTPAVNISCRGIVAAELEFTGSNSDLHSGLAGGLVYNPLHALVEVFSKLRNKDGSVNIAGFYDDVRVYSGEEKKKIFIDFDEKQFKQDFDAIASGGEKNFLPGERISYRPTLEINGLWGGYIQEGFKTVIPAKAHAKVSMRMVADQDPEKIFDAFCIAVKKLVPEGIKVEIKVEQNPSKAFMADLDSKLLQVSKAAFEAVFGKECKSLMCPGSVPIISALQAATQSDVLAIGVALNTDNVHAPNENFSVAQLEKGFLVMSEILNTLHK